MKKILVPVDFSDLTTDVLDAAAKIAKAFSGEVYIIHITGPDSFSNDIPPELSSSHNPAMDQHTLEDYDLKVMVDYLTAQNIPAKYGLFHGPVVGTIMLEAENYAADLIVVGAQSHGFLYRTFIGSTSGGVMRNTFCPVMIVPQR